jgi:hypothetical protein
VWDGKGGKGRCSVCIKQASDSSSELLSGAYGMLVYTGFRVQGLWKSVITQNPVYMRVCAT